MTVVVNGRFTHRPVTGVERFAREIVARLPEADVVAPRSSLGGLAGHAWEQGVLPRHVDGRTLLSPCNFGPVAVSDQVVVIHDVAPFVHPGGFSRTYIAACRLLQTRLSRRCRVATVSESSRRDIARVLGVDAAVVPNGVGAPFGPGPGTGQRGRYCVVVGGHDPRKNVAFLEQLWPEVHAQTGLELVVVARPGGAAFAAPPSTRSRWRFGIDDHELAELYRGAHCVLSPSINEGFGLPLLEGMACGTPFLATDTGSARELSVDPDLQLLPLTPSAWVRRLRDLDVDALGRAGLDIARSRRWEASVDVLTQLLRQPASTVRR